MERPAKRYFCNKCGYVGNVDLHSGCGYLAYHLAPFEQNYIDQLEAEIAKLRASPASATEGWKLVPVEPTEEMVNAFKSADLTELRRYGVTISRLLVRFTQNYRAMLAAAPTPPENKALLEAVAEVVWYDPQLSHFPEKPGKIIDGSIAFMESAEIGTKLFAAPVSSVSEDRKELELYKELLYAVVNKFPGESRHQTALRYIRNAEKGSDNAAMQEVTP